jgi:core-2/I-Branching enzyme
MIFGRKPMHAVLITAYKDFASLERLVRRLDRGFFKVFIHIDRRSSIGRKQIEQLKRLGAWVIKDYHVRWGAMTHLYAMIDLLRQASSVGGVDYFHLVSGQDYPLCDAAAFDRRCDGRIFMDFRPVAGETDYIKDRYRLRNLFYFLQLGSSVSNRLYRLLDGPSRWVQKRLGVCRTRFGPFDTLYKGTAWMSLPAAAVAELLRDRVADEFLGAITITYLPEEIFFQTYFLNSRLSASVVNDDLRYIDWSNRNGSIPAILDESDLEPILRSNALFARKISSDVSTRLLDQIDAACLDERQFREAAE